MISKSGFVKLYLAELEQRVLFCFSISFKEEHIKKTKVIAVMRGLSISCLSTLSCDDWRLNTRRIRQDMSAFTRTWPGSLYVWLCSFLILSFVGILAYP